MRLVKESLNEFHKTGEVKSGLGIGTIEIIKSWIEEYSSEDISDRDPEKMINCISSIIYEKPLRDLRDSDSIPEWIYFLISKLDTVRLSVLSNLSAIQQSEEILDGNRIGESIRDGSAIEKLDDFSMKKEGGKILISFPEWSSFMDLYEDNPRWRGEVSDVYIKALLDGNGINFFDYDFSKTDILNYIQEYGNEETFRILKEFGKFEDSEDIAVDLLEDNEIAIKLKYALGEATSLADEWKIFKIVISKIGSTFDLIDTKWDENIEEYISEISFRGFWKLVYGLISGAEKWYINEREIEVISVPNIEDFNEALENNL